MHSTALPVCPSAHLRLQYPPRVAAWGEQQERGGAKPLLQAVGQVAQLQAASQGRQGGTDAPVVTSAASCSRRCGGLLLGCPFWWARPQRRQVEGQSVGLGAERQAVLQLRLQPELLSGPAVNALLLIMLGQYSGQVCRERGTGPGR